MTIWDGNLYDTTDIQSETFLQINSCGVQNTPADHTVIRKKGRRDHHILLCTEGECIALHSGKLHSLSAGDLIIYFPGEEQMYYFKTEGKTLWCHFSGNAAEELLRDAELSGGIYHLSKTDTVIERFYSMISRFHSAGNKKYAIPLLLELILHISDSVRESKEKELSEPIFRAMIYIHSNYNKHITLNELASIAGYSKSRFSHLFSEETHTTPKAYQTELRLEASRQLLLFSDDSVSEIAVSCGFDDPLYYSRIFKQRYDICPSEYRAAKRSNTIIWNTFTI